MQIIWFLHRSVAASPKLLRRLQAGSSGSSAAAQFVEGHDVVMYWGHPQPLINAHNHWRPDVDEQVCHPTRHTRVHICTHARRINTPDAHAVAAAGRRGMCTSSSS
jgi:hypothetical protein